MLLRGGRNVLNANTNRTDRHEYLIPKTSKKTKLTKNENQNHILSEPDAPCQSIVTPSVIILLVSELSDSLITNGVIPVGIPAHQGKTKKGLVVKETIFFVLTFWVHVLRPRNQRLQYGRLL